MRAPTLLATTAALLAWAACQTQPTIDAESSNVQEEAPMSEALPVGSRELKVMLDPSRFADPMASAAALEAEIRALVDVIDRGAEGTLAAIDEVRTVTFLDVPGSCALRRAGWAFRERVEADEREVTLKFRSEDRYLAAHEDVRPRSDVEGKTKFEEDIKPPYVSVFSQSSKVVVDPTAAFASVADVGALFPGLEEAELPLDAPLAPVGGLTIHEEVYGELEIDLGKEEADMSVTLWYDGGELPAVAELSFKYKSDDESYQPKSVRRGKALFEMIQQLEDWVAPESLTKTAFVYAQDPSFCAVTTSD